MVARINTGKSIRKALSYNEKKVQEGQAEVISAHYFLKDKEQLNFSEKMATFQKLISLNERTTTNTLHVSLNFDPSDKLDNEQLVAIANDYMNRIGFAEQPYLVYRHYDTGHPHIHIVSTNIQRDGSRISMHNMGRNQSESARKEIEATYGLVKAESKKQQQQDKVAPLSAAKLNPGKRATKAAISNVLSVVINQYKFSSLPELNAVLKLYNVTADRCAEGSYIHNKRGLLFRVLDEQGNKVGTPIKASLFHMKPTLANLEQKFAENEPLKHPYAKQLRSRIDFVLLSKGGMAMEQFVEQLRKEGVSVVLRQNNEGRVYGVTYIDHKNKTVFNGSDLGKAYSANAIVEKLKGASDVWEVKEVKDAKEKSILQVKEVASEQVSADSSKQDSILSETVTSTAAMNDNIPWQLKRKRKKKKLKQ